MYSGHRDPPVSLVVSKSLCFETVFDNEDVWIEVFTPPRQFEDFNKPWGSFIVKPSQVFYYRGGLNNMYNVISMNSGSRISLYYKIDDMSAKRRVLIGSERLYTEDLVSRFLQYELVSKFGIPKDVPNCVDWAYNHFMASGYTMGRYIDRIHSGTVFM